MLEYQKKAGLVILIGFLNSLTFIQQVEDTPSRPTVVQQPQQQEEQKVQD